MLKDLINQEQTSPEKCAGCGVQIKDRWAGKVIMLIALILKRSLKTSNINFPLL